MSRRTAVVGLLGVYLTLVGFVVALGGVVLWLLDSPSVFLGGLGLSVLGLTLLMSALTLDARRGELYE